MANTHTPLAANVIKGAGGAGGFGGASGQSKKALLQTQAKSHAKVLKEEGVVRIDNVLDQALADNIHKRVYEMHAESEQLVKDGSLQELERYAQVLLKENRSDMTIPIGQEAWVANALESIILKSPVGMTLANLIGKDAILYELSCMMSFPNSNRQVVHPDTPCNAQNEPVLYTCFVALQDITLDMGPTTFLPRTHNPAMHDKFADETKPIDGTGSCFPKDDLLQTQPSVVGLLPKGSCAIYDSRLLHCGGANISQKSRALFYFSFQNPKILNVGNPPSIRKDLIGKWNLKQMQSELELYGKGKPSRFLTTE
jgi:ectoine hydroxylase-related dioxygenase (phytanoyl-CoA dioxygenase family)